MRPRWDYQKPVVEYVKHNDNAILFLDKRLGKSAMSLDWVVRRRPRPAIILVVAPISAQEGWCREIKEDGYTPILLEGSIPERYSTLQSYAMLDQLKPKHPLFFITNSQSLFVPKAFSESEIAEPTPLATYTYDALIWDECLNLANPKSQINNVAQRYLSKTKFKCILSGEYVPTSPLQCFEQVRFAQGVFMGCRSYWNWRSKFFQQLGYGEWTPKIGTYPAIRKSINEVAYILSRKDAGVQDAPPFQENRTCELPLIIAQAYKAIRRTFYADLPGENGQGITCPACKGKGFSRKRDPEESGFLEEWCKYCDGQGMMKGIDTKYAVVVANWLLQIAGGFPKWFPHLHSTHKLSLLEEIIDERKGEPLVVTFTYNLEMEAVQKRLASRKIRTEILNGTMQPKDRRRVEADFQNGRFDILLLQARGCEGMNLSRADTMIRYSIPPSYRDISQSSDRIVHPTKKRPLLYINLICKKTVDVDVQMLAVEHKHTSRYFMVNLLERLRKAA